jgi:hypothetical protein
MILQDIQKLTDLYLGAHIVLMRLPQSGSHQRPRMSPAVRRARMTRR